MARFPVEEPEPAIAAKQHGAVIHRVAPADSLIQLYTRDMGFVVDTSPWSGLA